MKPHEIDGSRGANRPDPKGSPEAAQNGGTGTDVQCWGGIEREIAERSPGRVTWLVVVGDAVVGRHAVRRDAEAQLLTIRGGRHVG